MIFKNTPNTPQKNRSLKLILTLLIFILLALGIYAYINMNQPTEAKSEEPPKVLTVEELVSEAYMTSIVTELTAPEYAGRLPGTAGNEKAVSFIRNEMKNLGLSIPSFTEDYLMPFEMLLPIKNSVTELSLEMSSGQVDFEYGTDFTEITFRDFAKAKGSFKGGFTLISDGSNLYDFKLMGSPDIVVYQEEAIEGLNLEVMFNNILQQPDAPKVILYEFNQKNSDHFILSPYSRMMTGEEAENAILIYKVSKDLVTVLAGEPEGTLNVKTDVNISTVEVPNVIGFIDGSGDEGYIISAHFDHLGDNFDGSYNAGALDNASGTATMLALAKAIKQTADPTIDYYFIAFNGEEEGLYGSAHFASVLPLNPEHFKVVNVDMVGSSSDTSLEIAATSGKSILFQDEAFNLAGELGIIAIKTDKGSSDHVPLSDVGFVTISLTELDKRFYHTPNDTPEHSLNYKEMDQVGEYIYKLLFPVEESVTVTP